MTRRPRLIHTSRGRSKTIGGALALAMVMFPLAACGAGSGDPDAEVKPDDGTATIEVVEDARNLLPDEIKTSGILIVANDPTQGPPMAYIDESSGEAAGSDIEIAHAIASALGLKSDVRQVPFPGILTGLQAEKFSVAITGMGDTEERHSAADFVDYQKIAVVLLTPKGNPGKVGAWDDLCGKNIGVTAGTNQEVLLSEASSACVSDGKREIGINNITGGADLITAVTSGRVDASAVDGPIAGNLAQTQPDKFEIPPASIVESGYLGVVIPKGNDELVQAIQAALTGLKEQGVYDAIFAKYGLTDLAVDEFTINNAGA